MNVHITLDALWRPQVFTTLAGGPDRLYRKLEDRKYQEIATGRVFDLDKMWPGLVIEITSVDHRPVNQHLYAEK